MSERDNRGSLDALRRLSDEQLAQAAARGDEAPARVLLERFEEPLYRYTLALVRDPDLAREATWSALFEAARAVRAGEHAEPVGPWIVRVAHTAADVAGGRPNGASVADDEAAARAAAAGGEERDRLEQLLERLDALPERERGSLLLRELVGLEYAGIATVTGARVPAARQAVYRARLALQGDVDAPTEHCDEIRAAMSKAEGGIRERRSIAVHLEDCPVCAEFAHQLETRPDDLRRLFPAPPEPLAAELLPPLPPVVAAAGADAADGVEAERAPRTAIQPGERDRRSRRPVLAALALLLLLAGGAIAAVALNDNGGGDKGRAAAARAGGGAKTEERDLTPSKRSGGAGKSGSGASKANSGDKTSKSGAGKSGAGSSSKSGAGKSTAGGAGAGAGAGSSSSGSSASGSEGSGSAPSDSAGSEAPGSDDSGSDDSGSDDSDSAGSEAPGSDDSGSAPSGSAGSEASDSAGSGSEASGSAGSGSAEADASRARSERCPSHATSCEAGAVPRTGLDVSLVIAAGFLLLALGISVRRLDPGH